MTKKNFLQNLVEQITEALPDHMSSLKTDFEKNCQNIISKAFSKLDLVTREEFDVQTKVLIRTRKKIETLEKQVKILEAALSKRKQK